jgi:uncharacterized membrane protein YdjX (TVP38/TMEM64 family)
MAVRRVKLIIFIAVIVVLAAVTATGPVVGWLMDLFGRIARLGPWGPVALAVFYAFSCVVLIPASIPTLAAGFLFDLFTGTVAAMAGGTMGACAAFWISRAVARNWVADRVVRHRRFALLDDAVGKQGFRVVVLARLSPLAPYVLLNYALGLTKVSFGEYALGTVVGVLPGMVLYVYFGAGLRSLAELAAYAGGEGETSPAYRAFFWGGLAVTVVVTLLLTRIAQKALRGAASREA